MSTNIEDRVVEMRFDNKDFEKNVQTSLSTLDKLKQSLNLTGATKGLENIESATRGVNMSGLGSAVETVSAKFSALQVMGVTALVNITNSAVNAGKKIISALTIDPLKTGFNEYELKINSVQTIMAGTGESLKTVNKYLDELNVYADRTIYSFSDMTSNIGKFTNAGVSLKDSVAAIQGISNVAAISGANTNEASRAMYNFAQALSAGHVKLIDWKSIENANMATVEFKTQLLESAVAAGTLEKTADGMYKVLTTNNKGGTMDETISATKNFNDSLSYQWMTTNALVGTLGDYADETTAIGKKAFAAAQDIKTFTQLWDVLKESAQSGWAASWEIIVGDFDEAKELLTELGEIFSGMIQTSADVRNNLLEGWKDLGGRTALVDSLRNALNGILSIVKPVKEAFREIFPPMTAQQLFNFTESLKKLTASMTLSEKTSNNLKRTFKGLFAVLDIAGQAFGAIANAIFPMTKGVGDLGGGILEVTAGFGDWLVELNETIRTTDVFNNIVQGLVGFITDAVTIVKKFASIIGEHIVFPGFELLHALLERIHTRMAWVGDAAITMKGVVTKAFELMGDALSNNDFIQKMEKLWTGIQKIIGGVGTFLSTIGGKLLQNANFDTALDVFNSFVAGGVGISIVKLLTGVTESITKTVGSFTGLFKGIKDITNGIVGILDSVRGCFEAYQTKLKADALLKIATAIAVLAGSIFIISLIDSDKLTGSLAAITLMFYELMGAMAVFTKISGNYKNVMKSISMMTAMSTSVLILAVALKTIGSLEFGQMATGLTGVIGLTTTMVLAAKSMSKNSKTMITGATQMVIFAAAIKILASACADLSVLDWEGLTKGLVGVGVLMAEVAIFLKIANMSNKSITTATGIVILAAALKILASATKDFGSMNWDEINRGLTAMGVLLTEIAAFTYLTGNAKHVISTGVALIAIGAAMKILASALSDFADIPEDKITNGLLGMATSLLAITLAVNLMPKNMIGIGVGLIAISTALVILANAMKQFGGMTWDEIGRGLTSLGGAMAILAIGLHAMNGTLAGSAALLIAVVSLTALVPILSILGAMSWEAIAKGLVALAGAFAVIGVAGLILKPLVPAILGLGAAFTLIGIGVLGIGVGLMAAGAGLSGLAIGFTALTVALAAGATAIVASLSVVIMGVANLIPAVMAKIGEGMVTWLTVLADMAPAWGKAIKSIVLSLIDVLVECIPAVVDGLLELVAGLLKALADNAPQIVDSLLKFIIGIIESIAANLPALIKAGVDLLMAFFSGIADAMKGIDVNVLLKGIVGIGLLSAMMIALTAVAVLVPGAMLGVLAMGLLIGELALVLAAVGALSKIPGLTWLVGEGGKFLEVLGTAIGSFIGGIVGGIMGGITSSFPKIGTDLSNFMINAKPFIDGASKINSSVTEGVKALAETVLILTAADILQGLTSWFTGGSSIAEFGKELAEFGPHFSKYYDSIKGMDGSVVQASANAAKSLAEMANNLPNSGGVVGWFSGENSLSKFAEELMVFGPKLKAYSDSVKGLDATVVINSANAAKALAEMATNLPNQGGVVGWFAGENSLSTFADELAEFGPVLKKYADSVRGLDPNVVVASGNAAKALAEMANNLPNQGGVVSWFTGDNKLSTFGNELAEFGPGLKKFADSISGLDPNVVTNSANAAKALSELAANLPNSGGIISWFTGDNDIATFGEQLVVFGESFAAYYNSVSGIDTGKLSGVVAEFKKIVDLAKGLEEINITSLSTFGQSLTTLGKTGVDGFIKAFTDAEFRITTAATTMITTFINGVNSKKQTLTTTFETLLQAVLTAMDNKQGKFNTVGVTLMNKFIDGIKSKNQLAKTTVKDIITDCLTIIKGYNQDFQLTGQGSMTHMIAGVESKASSIVTAFNNAISGSITSIRNRHSEFYSAGSYLVDGFANGISDNTYKAAAKAGAMATAAAEAAKRALQVRSPSRIFYSIGDYAGLGFVNALSEYVKKAANAGANMATGATDGLKNAISKISNLIDGEVDTQPTIKPVLDLTNIQNGTSKLYKYMNSVSGFTLSGSINAANQTANSIARSRAASSIESTESTDIKELIQLTKDLLNNQTRPIENTFHITGADPKEIAEEVSRIIQKQVERREAQWV